MILSPALSPAAASTEKRSYIVRFKDGVDVGREDASLAWLSSRFRRVFENVFNGAQVELTDPEAALLRSDPRVTAVEPDQVVSLTATQSGPPWGLDRIDQRGLPLSGTYGSPDRAGANVTVYIVDSGIRRTHQDFGGPGGRVRWGMSFGGAGGSDDCYGHGTHVAGTVGGATYGVAKAVTLVPVQIYDCDGKSTMSLIISALDFIAEDHTPGTPAVVNMSFGVNSIALFDSAVERLIQAGITVVTSAGNDAADACTKSPGRLPPVITVGATDSSDRVAGFSNQGPCVDLFAPGVGIRSTSMSSDTASVVMNGTSMAAPHVTGAVAVLLGQQPSLTPAEVATALVSAATPEVINRKTQTTNRLLYSAPPHPDNDDFARATRIAPEGSRKLRGTNVGATKEAGEPAHAGSAATSSVWWAFTPSTDGTITASTAGSNFDTVAALYTGDSVAGLTGVAANDDAPFDAYSVVSAAVKAGTTYHLTVDGRGGDSGEITVWLTLTPDTAPVPGAPAITDVVPGNGSATVTWTPPTGGNPITAYTVRAYNAGSALAGETTTGPGTTATVGGLQNGTPYTFTVLAITAGGKGPESAPSGPVTPRTVPDAPTNLSATPSDRGAVISWSAPSSDGGAPIESYTVTTFADGTRVRSDAFLPANTAVIGNLANGTPYTFTVMAINAAGPGPASDPSAAVTPAVPVPEAPPPPPPPPAVNHAPVVAPDAYNVTGGTSLSVPAAQGVLANDHDPDGDFLSAVVSDPPVHGSIVLDRLGGFTYTPAPGWVGSDSVGYEVRDGLGGITTATVTFDTTAAPTSIGGYWMLSDHGRVYTFGNARSFSDGSPGATDLEPTPRGDGYWILHADGAVRNFGAAPSLGGSPALRPGETAASLSVTPSGNGYWVFTDAGRVFAYGDAPHLGDMSGTTLNRPVLDSVSTPSGRGYWMVASDGGIFSFGDAKFSGSMGNTRLNQPVISMAPDPDGTGYWLVAADGGIFAFDATFFGSMGNVRLNRPVSGMVPGPAGYLMVAEDGGIFAFGNLPFHGSLGSTPPPRPIVAVALAR